MEFKSCGKCKDGYIYKTDPTGFFQVATECDCHKKWVAENQLERQYKHNGFDGDVEILKNDFTANLGGMYMVDYPDIPDWETYSGYKNNLVFSKIKIPATSYNICLF